MSRSADQREPIEALAEEFLERKRRGEQPTLEEYVARHPELADEIRDIFPALMMMENLGDASSGTTGPVVPLDASPSFSIITSAGKRSRISSASSG